VNNFKVRSIISEEYIFEVLYPPKQFFLFEHCHCLHLQQKQNISEEYILEVLYQESIEK